ncbi:uncharacterized protein LOC133467415 [Phyllopteryx taeniolatus]|uniref:uncharacterized protein LOC133467415 n=1 Tax=Phyllopteryx taeniolatus TaxID=161469 RepID=UPI002AD413C6|nr:uncharacterized protein LOC133467415 [Phyllopteryx taeniolatus]
MQTMCRTTTQQRPRAIMNSREDCSDTLAALLLLSVALFVSLCVNATCCVTRRASLCADRCCCAYIHAADRPSQEGRWHFVNANRPEEQDKADHNHQNPIYGNIKGSGDFDTLRVPHVNPYFNATLQAQKKPSEDTLMNYASLDLNVAKQRQQKLQGNRSKQLSVHVTDTSHGPHFGSVDSQSSVYLNSEYIAQETDTIEKRGMCSYSEAVKLDRV